MRFLDVNQRHHSMAICPVPRGEPPSLAHLTVGRLPRRSGGTPTSYWGDDWSAAEHLAAFTPPK
ncbi:hypothetical protein [Amycolatopsis sp. NPDC054798]